MAVDDPLIAEVIGVAGKYVFLDVGSQDNVQVDDIFDDYEFFPLKSNSDPKRKFKGLQIPNDPRSGRSWAKAVIAELQVERVFDDHCYAVVRYSSEIDHFKPGDTVERGHSHRIIATGTLQGK